MGEPGQSFARDDRNEDRFPANPAPVERQYRVDDLRLDGEDHRIRHQFARQCVGRPVPFHGGVRSKGGRRPLRLDDENAGGRAVRDPAAEHRRPHLAAADKDEAAACSFAANHAQLPLAQASPTGSIIADAIA